MPRGWRQIYDDSWSLERKRRRRIGSLPSQLQTNRANKGHCRSDASRQRSGNYSADRSARPPADLSPFNRLLANCRRRRRQLNRRLNRRPSLCVVARSIKRGQLVGVVAGSLFHQFQDCWLASSQRFVEWALRERCGFIYY